MNSLSLPLVQKTPVTSAGTQVKETTRLRDWTKAESLLRKWDAGQKPTNAERVTIQAWRDACLADLGPSGRNLADVTAGKYRVLFKQLEAFATDKGYRFVNQLDLVALSNFRQTWKDAPMAASKKLKRLRNVFKFALRRDWVTKNPAMDLDMPKFKLKPALPFSDAEVKAILKSATDTRTNVLIRVMLASGLRISDTVLLAVDSLADDRLRLHQAKTGEFVSILIPEKLADELRALPKKNPKYFFRGKQSSDVIAAAIWQPVLKKVFDDAKIVGGHSHRFRDTFAVNLFNAGVSIEAVSRLLGHTNTKVTSEHYSPWVKSRQDALDREILKAGSAGLADWS